MDMTALLIVVHQLTKLALLQKIHLEFSKINSE